MSLHASGLADVGSQQGSLWQDPAQLNSYRQEGSYEGGNVDTFADDQMPPSSWQLTAKYPAPRIREHPGQEGGFVPSDGLLPSRICTASNRRGTGLSLPRFDELSPLPSVMPPDSMEMSLGLHFLASAPPFKTMPAPAVSPQHFIPSNSLGPLTPPHEIEAIPWLPSAEIDQKRYGTYESAEKADSAEGTSPGVRVPLPLATVPIESFFDGAEHEPALQQMQEGPWLSRALRSATEAFRDVAASSTKVVSQVLPPCASDQRPTKTYESICEHLQQILPEPQYISITHILAVAPGQVLEDFPKSPPVTPSNSRVDGYFGDQTVFTHAAQVPVHHDFRAPGAELPVPIQRHIMSAEANLTLLERYIPPTTCDELFDFFNVHSYRSYLADRLTELAVDSGSLLLVYPTRRGGQSFARNYLAPVLDPLLREMTILKGLNTNAAERLGRMRVLESMFEYNALKSKVEEFCTAMNARPNTRQLRSAYAVTHQDTASVVLDRNTWITWFIEQEQQRMKQDLVEYHRDGGKLPEGGRNKSELTAGMLTREIVESVRKSTTTAGMVGIEVGVFVIRRTRQVTMK